MIDTRNLISANVKPPEGMRVAMAVKIGEQSFYMIAYVKDGKWVSEKQGLQVPSNPLGWTGLDDSWGHRNP